LAVFGLLWLLCLSVFQQTLSDVQKTHQRLRADLNAKRLLAATLPEVQAQHAAMEVRLLQLENKLPGSQDMALLLADLSRAGRARKLRFELLRPAEIGRQLPYAQQRIAVRVVGRYQDLAGFAADLASFNWLLSIQGFTLLPSPKGALVMDASMRIFRPLAMTETAVSTSTSSKDAP
jgi:type IV pilus assembly protein PilO